MLMFIISTIASVTGLICFFAGAYVVTYICAVITIIETLIGVFTGALKHPIQSIFSIFLWGAVGAFIGNKLSFPILSSAAVAQCIVHVILSIIGIVFMIIAVKTTNTPPIESNNDVTPSERMCLELGILIRAVYITSLIKKLSADNKLITEAACCAGVIACQTLRSSLASASFVVEGQDLIIATIYSEVLGINVDERNAKRFVDDFKDIDKTIFHYAESIHDDTGITLDRCVVLAVVDSLCDSANYTPEKTSVVQEETFLLYDLIKEIIGKYCLLESDVKS
jgi:hypothetical protein